MKTLSLPKQTKKSLFLVKKSDSKGKDEAQKTSVLWTETKGFDNWSRCYDIPSAERHMPSAGETV